MVDTAGIYLLTGEAAWIDFPDPGFHRQADGTLNPGCRRHLWRGSYCIHITAECEASRQRHSQQSGAEGVPLQPQRHWSDLQEIIALLMTRYGQKITSDINDQDGRWHMDWNPSEPIEELID